MYTKWTCHFGFQEASGHDLSPQQSRLLKDTKLCMAEELTLAQLKCKGIELRKVAGAQAKGKWAIYVGGWAIIQEFQTPKPVTTLLDPFAGHLPSSPPLVPTPPTSPLPPWGYFNQTLLYFLIHWLMCQPSHCNSQHPLYMREETLCKFFFLGPIGHFWPPEDVNRSSSSSSLSLMVNCVLSTRFAHHHMM